MVDLTIPSKENTSSIRAQSLIEDGLTPEEAELLTTPIKHMLGEKNQAFLQRAFLAKDRHVLAVEKLNKEYEKTNTKSDKKTVYLHRTSSKQG